jgi:hypothetical protein
MGVTNAAAMASIMMIMVNVTKLGLAQRGLENINPTAMINVSIDSMLFAKFEVIERALFKISRKRKTSDTMMKISPEVSVIGCAVIVESLNA